ncbi:Mitochondrial glycoprotein [Dioscorea alata]|uniref:Mitochondrial glycoprotein n=1 Tax=Dioscorea alata TaxID=55571 RepID=A0ACB7WMC4_DIOAL|nr:Mitochondrial glycoprotein [Dioscorea alata]
MARSASSLLLRRFLRHPIPSPSPLLSHHRPLFYSSLVRSRAVSQVLERPQFLTSLRFASANAKPKLSADDNISKVLYSEIDCAERECVDREDSDLPKDFPFEIVDNPGDQSITLKREFAGEKIQVNVFMELDDMGDMNEDDEDDGNDDDDDHEDGGSPMPKISLIALIDKGEGPSLEFCCDLAADGLHIESMLLKRDDSSSEEGNAYEGPEFSDLDENLQKAFYKYLEERGISPSLREFLHEYMTQKEDREYLNWLKNMKSFIEK